MKPTFDTTGLVARARARFDWLIVTILMLVVCATLACPSAFGQLTVANYVRSATVAVTNGSPTNITCPMASAHVVQVYIKPSSTAQVYTITFPNSDTVEVPSGGIFTMRIVDKLANGQVLFAVTTATGAANLQVIAFRESK